MNNTLGSNKDWAAQMMKSVEKSSPSSSPVSNRKSPNNRNHQGEPRLGQTNITLKPIGWGVKNPLFNKVSRQTMLEQPHKRAFDF